MGSSCCKENYTTNIIGPILFNGNYELEIEFINIMSKLQNFLINNNLVYSYDIYHKNENGLIANINNLKESLFITSEPYYIKEIYIYDEHLIDLKKIIKIYKTNKIIIEYCNFKKKYVNSNKIYIKRFQQFNKKIEENINDYISDSD